MRNYYAGPKFILCDVLIFVFKCDIIVMQMEFVFNNVILFVADSNISIAESDSDSSDESCSDYQAIHSARTKAEMKHVMYKNEFKGWAENIKRSEFEMALKVANQTLYEDVDLTLMSAALLVMKYIHFHKMPLKSIGRAIRFVKCFAPKQYRSKFKRVKSFIDNNFLKAFTPEKHFFCSACYKLLKLKREKAQTCDSCQRKSSSGEFFLASVEAQLQAILQRKKIRHLILNRKTCHDSSIISNVYDGRIYKAHREFLNVKKNISLSYYSDGVALYTSSKLSIWPFYLHINELPIEERYKIENTILLGLWCDKEKPFFNTYLEPTIPFFDSFRTTGIIIKYIENDKEYSFIMKGILIFGSGDAPARAILLNFIQFNGHHGCSVCLQDPQTVETILRERKSKDTNVKDSKRAKTSADTTDTCNTQVKHSKNLVYKYEKNMTLRTTEATMKLAHKAEEEKKPQKGVKGVSVLSLIVWMYFVESMALDTMHSVFSGIGKRLIELWFDKLYKDCKFSLYKFLMVVDAYLAQIKHPNFCTRRPRPFTGHLSFYTTSEIKNWVMYFSIPILQQIMEREYFEHYFLLVEAMFILHQDSITQNDLVKAECLLHKFVSTFELLYDLKFMSFNVHSLLHLPDVVRNLGPLSQLNCFPLEKLNGRIKKWVKGSNSPQTGILSYLSAAQTMPSYIELMPDDTEEKDFINDLDTSNQASRLENIKDNTWSLGIQYKTCDAVFKDLILEALENSELVAPSENLKSAEIFQRLKIGKAIYTSKMNTVTETTMSYCIEYGPNKNVGLVEFYAKIKICNCSTDVCSCSNEFVAVIKKCKTLSISSTIPVNSFINKISLVGELSIIRATDIKYMCAYVPIPNDIDTIYCIRRMNLCESE